MSDALGALQPRSVWGHFSNLAAIPRPSKHEQRVVAWVRGLAAEHGFEVRSDQVGNLVLVVPASPGREGAPVVILQSHLDMVCEKNKDVTHDFMRDPIRPRLDGAWVGASGTTLGADNGIGVAAALAAATDPEVVHGPLELLFTLDEETGLTGAAGLDGSMLRGRKLLNLDSEEDGTLFVGCAGGADTRFYLEAPETAAGAGRETLRVEVVGLRGGHSGLNIHENRGNALKLLALFLDRARRSGIEFELAELHGGSMHNAIPREAEATLTLGAADGARFRALAEKSRGEFLTALRGIDDGLQVRVTAAEPAQRVLTAEARDRLLRLLLVLPHGVLGMSPDLPGLVETSSNLAVVQPADARIRVIASSRSSVAPTLQGVVAGLRAAGELAGAEIETRDGYPGWKPDLDSALLGVVRGVYAELWQREPHVTAIHAGLECGLLGQKIAGLEMISFGPQIEGAHSPDERVHVGSVQRFWDALRRVLAELAGAARQA